MFFDICNTEMAQSLSSLQKSESLKLIILIFHVFRFLEFFHFFLLKPVYFWTKSRKNIYGCFFHSFCATDPNFGTKNNGRMK